jgi:hypothetical protein
MKTREVCKKIDTRRHCVPSMCVAYEPTETGREYDPCRYQPIEPKECVYYIGEEETC